MLMIPPNFLRQEDKAVEFLSGLFQMLGPIGVLVGGFAAASLSYTPSKHEALSWLLPIYVAPMVGAYFITTAYIFRTVAAANRDFAARLFDWETGGPARGSKPRLRWRTWMPKHLLWWGGVFLSLGGVIFCMGTTARLAGQFNNVHYTGVQSLVLEKVCIAIGGMFMLIGAGLHIAKEIGWLVSKGTMYPPTKAEWRSPKFWMNWCTWWGSMLYFVRGYFPILSAHLAPRTFRLCNAIGFGVGSLILMTGGYLLILKMIVREDDPELELHQRLQGGDEEAMNGKLLAMAEVLGHSRDKMRLQQQREAAQAARSPQAGSQSSYCRD
ncbi:g7550 [Coccomyxa viridis]|uniref:G7550 protein n=1 Tax=Coccomyxa viridis TaxID=1274662 RepID=A0ABP1G269_9CHLO